MDGETDEQRFLRELNRLLAEPEPDEADVDARLREQEQRPAHDPSIEATRSLLRAVQEAQGVGIRTVVTLDAQGEQLDNVERALDDLAADLDSAEADLSEIAKEKKKKQASDKGTSRAPSERARSSETTTAAASGTASTGRGGDKLSVALTDLKGIAQDIGHRLDTHNEQTDRLTASASSSEERVRKASKRSEEILKDD